ncbi:MAG: hypothetical protein K2L70_00890 [Clostridia bacterium]|nr:hypothetical protein [Clostridia bacterium]
MRNYGYKLCYKKQNNSKLKVYIFTNSYSLANWHKKAYEKNSPLKNATWTVLPINSHWEYVQRWKGCPF